MEQKEIDFLKTQNITVKQSIAKGGFDEVFLVYSSQYKSDFALKKIQTKRFNRAEVECLKAIDHVNIMNLYKYFYFDGCVYLLTEYCPFDLYHLLKEKGSLSEDLLQKYCLQIVSSIKACHDHNIAHNDIKPSNFLLDKYGRIKACDFGISTIFKSEPTSSSSKGTLLFMAPEMLAEKKHNPLKADIWALGVTLFYLATRTYPFLASDSKLLLKVINDGGVPLKAVSNPLLRNVIARCLEYDPNTRADVNELLEMPYFNSGCNETKVNHVGSSISPFHPIIKPKIAYDSKLGLSHLSLIPSRRPPSLSNIHSNNTH
ncbi:CAMK family protein kinase [Trichomonas vaginalis G3]|uniref:CAMK family protein kinase n=1 Tax=Trichomonas vaginalis (strain ATCC PRA-98 / G3) TaxID=412133 RepID=A2ENB4_TRIV3|nr:positive regulation of hh target transcription factor protein [Trichomonas vaginalis G3]EAY05873.1 CAMK family protein kinase [Trichomonas vaginalis G3]KAI5531682.1 positive regulation of hh target transcription factor protein [Trichomonas vaginalis G3]|eukprot:XP_001318096.1 CAMK family protein kinase [Trichomonas vaginalis G3]